MFPWKKYQCSSILLKIDKIIEIFTFYLKYNLKHDTDKLSVISIFKK